MAPPANDTRAGAQLVPVGSYWGVVTGGTTVDATEDAGGPVDGYGAQDVFYYWASLPAGEVFIHVKPQPGHEGTYFEAALASVAPDDWDSSVDWIGSGYWGPSVGDDLFPCVFQGTHAGGPLSLVVYTYTGDATGDDTVFDFGWGHELDATSSHWGATQSEPWINRATEGAGPGNATRGIFQTAEDYISGHVSFPPLSATVECSWGNAAHGVVRDIPSGFGCPGYIGPEPGTTASTFTDFASNVGQYHTGTTGTAFLPDRTNRTDRVGVQQTAYGINLGETYTSDMDIAAEPDSFLDYAIANGREVDQAVWGWEWDGTTFALRDLSFDLTSTADNGSADFEDDCDVVFLAVPQAYVVATPSFTVANEISLSDSGGTVSGTYFEPDVLGAEILAIADGSATYTIADPAPLLVTTATDPTPKWLAGVFVAQQTLDGVYPTWQEDGAAAGNRALSGYSSPTFDSRAPDWRPYLGFPLIPPAPSGWRVGRVGAGNTPW